MDRVNETGTRAPSAPRKDLLPFYICTFISFSFSVLSNKLEAPMLSSIIAALSQEIVPQGNLKNQQFAVVYVSMYVCDMYLVKGPC